MIDTKCENCGEVIGALETPEVWKDHAVCHKCHSKLMAQSGREALVSGGHGKHEVVAATSNTSVPRVPQSVCPKCGSENVQRIAVSYASGTATCSQTALARAMAPPPEPDRPEGIFRALVWGGSMLGTSLLAFLTSMSRGTFAEQGQRTMAFYLGILLAVVGVVLVVIFLRVQKKAMPAYKAQMASHRREMQLWRQSYVCLRCGTPYLPAGQNA